MNPHSPALARAAPFGAFIVALALRGALQDATYLDGRWLYLLQLIGAVALLLLFTGCYDELRRPVSPKAALVSCFVGLVVFWIWIRATLPWMSIGTSAASFEPIDVQGGLRCDLICMRLAGAVVIVPVMEELFWRSFLMRWIDRRDFLALPPGRSSFSALLVSSGAFALAHQLWLAGLIAGLSYGWIYRRTANLWLSILAHAATNLMLGLWVIDQRAWSFW
jgi:hypothetical protein